MTLKDILIHRMRYLGKGFIYRTEARIVVILIFVWLAWFLIGLSMYEPEAPDDPYGRTMTPIEVNDL